MKKLFIYIPTFNRPESLTTQLNALLPQVIGNENVRLQINDNASSKLNCQALRSLLKYDNIEVTRNECNVGGNANIIFGFHYCREDEALWILSDNDIVWENAVKSILHELEHEFDIICMRAELERFSPHEVYRWEEGWSSAIATDTGLISAVVYKTAKFYPYVISGYLYHNTSFPHLAILLEFAKATGEIVFRNINRCFDPQMFGTDEKTDYSLSKLGMPLLAQLMPTDKAIVFCVAWLNEWRDSFYAQRERNTAVFDHTFGYLKDLSPLTAEILLKDGLIKQCF